MISQPEWNNIAKMVERIVNSLVGQRSSYFITGTVLSVDEPNKCIFMKEFGDQPIPIVGFDYTVNYYDTNQSGVVAKKTAKVLLTMPKRGQTVLVAREMGTNRLPRCLGVIQGKNWILPEVE